MPLGGVWAKLSASKASKGDQYPTAVCAKQRSGAKVCADHAGRLAQNGLHLLEEGLTAHFACVQAVDMQRASELGTQTSVDASPVSAQALGKGSTRWINEARLFYKSATFAVLVVFKLRTHNPYGAERLRRAGEARGSKGMLGN
jgi:hypothetical protein